MYTLGRCLLMSLASVGAVALIGLAGGTIAQADPGDPVADIAEYKSTHDQDPHIPLTGQQQALLAEKSRAARAYFASRQQSAAPASASYGRYLPVAQQGQQTSYYCGPAAVSELLNYKLPATSQSTAAYWLNTTTNGTDWSGWNRVPAPYYTAHPVPDVLNYRRGVMFYVPVSLPSNPSSDHVQTYITLMTYDIDSNYPVVGDAWEYPGWPHLFNHPNIEIFHWFTINGYYANGSQTDYLDSATTVWPQVQAYNFYFDSATLVYYILSGRGYVW